MVSCLILYHSTITSLTKCKILRAMFKEEEFEIDVIENNTVMIYLWNVEKERIWQAAIDFETTNIVSGYGFGRRKIDARIQAFEVLHHILNDGNSDSNDTWSVHENPESYALKIAF